MSVTVQGTKPDVSPSFPSQVMSVSRGTFSHYRDQLIGGSATFLLQFKQPRVLRTEEQVHFFLQRRLQEKQRRE